MKILSFLLNICGYFSVERYHATSEGFYGELDRHGHFELHFYRKDSSNSLFVSHRIQNNSIWACNAMKVYKYWQNLNFWVYYSFKQNQKKTLA